MSVFHRSLKELLKRRVGDYESVPLILSLYISNETRSTQKRVKNTGFTSRSNVL